MQKKTIIIVIIAIIVLAIGGGLYKYYQPQKNFAASKPDYVLSVGELFAAFENNENSANQKFVTSNCTTQVNGILHDKVFESDSTITLVIIEKDNSDTFLNCNLAFCDHSIIDQLAIGLPVSVKGQCTGYQALIDKTIYMIRGSIVK